eukprot:4191787-Prymnesium_polylepis.1
MAPLEGLCSETEARWFYWGWSRVYDMMQPFFTSDEMREQGLDLASIKPGSSNVLDVGAGTGTLSLQVLRRHPTAKLTLLDQSRQMLDRAKVKPELGGCAFELCDAQVLPFDDNAFDHVVSSGTLYYYPQPVQAMREQLRVVKPGGTVLAMGSLQPKPRFIRLLATTFNRFPTEEDYVGWFTEAGLTNVQTKYISNPWNVQQYALAICGTKAAGTPQPERAQPVSAARPRSWLRTLFFETPLRIARFGLSMAAFSILGPLQITNAALGQRRLAAAAKA